MWQQLRDALLKHRRGVILLAHAVLGAAAYVLAFCIRFDCGTIPEGYQPLCAVGLPFAVGLKLASLMLFGAMVGLWRYVSICDLLSILKAVTAYSLVFIAGTFLVYGHGFPRSIFVLDYLLTITFYGGMRFAMRLVRESFRPVVRRNAGTRTLIVGAGDAGEIALRQLIKDQMGFYKVVGFLDDDPHKQNQSIHGYPILGTTAAIADIIQQHEVREVLIAISSSHKSVIRGIVERATACNVRFQIMPAIEDLMTGRLDFQRIRNVRLEDLLGRDPIRLDKKAVSDAVRGTCVLVTGAGGSIGSELARQLASHGPGQLVLLDAAESALFEIDRELAVTFPNVPRLAVIADIKHREEIDAVFASCRPCRVYHAAAYKHVPLMEQHPFQAICNNILGTRIVAEAAIRHGVERFVMISSDKAVRPSSIMGATKRICEILVARCGGNGTRFSAVRFGNVLGSNGSVIPIFEKQIAAGGPVTVTHAEMTRYFMTIPEAVELVLQTSILGQGHEIYVLDMGTPVKIMDLARNMIELCGLQVGEDIQIAVTGLRPGEKLTEELVADGEEVMPTTVPHVIVLKPAPYEMGGPSFEQALAELLQAASDRDEERSLAGLWKIIGDDRAAAKAGGSAQKPREDEID